jgi:hypothetical protein
MSRSVEEELVPRVLSIGAAEAAEFAVVRDAIRPLERTGRFLHLSELAAWKPSPGDDAPELILVWQRFSDEYPAGDIARLLAAVPLARIVVIYGAWCEADGRTRTAWPAGLRVPVWQATARIRQEWGCLTGEGVPLPWTASREEAWLRDVAAAGDGSLSGHRIALELADPAYRITLAERLAAAGAKIVDSLMEATDVIVDLDPWSDVVAANLEARRVDFAGRRMIGLSAWITPELRAAAGGLSIATVVSKLDPVAIEAALLSG